MANETVKLILKEIFMYRIRKSWCVVMHMLGDRGFVIPDESKYYCLDCDAAMNPDENTCDCYNNFIEWVGEDESEARKIMTVIFSKKSDPTQQVMTFWTTQCGVGDVQKIQEQMTESEVSHSILVHNNKITSNAATAMKNLRVQGRIVEVFHEDEVQYVVTRSKLVPRHIICSKAKMEEVLGAYKVVKTQLPEIKITDPIIRYIGAVRGQLIKIVRPSESVGHISNKGDRKELYDIYYRIVV